MKALTTSEILSIAYSIETVARKSVSWTADGGIPDKKDAWLIPGITTTGWVYFEIF